MSSNNEHKSEIVDETTVTANTTDIDMTGSDNVSNITDVNGNGVRADPSATPMTAIKVTALTTNINNNNNSGLGSISGIPNSREFDSCRWTRADHQTLVTYIFNRIYRIVSLKQIVQMVIDPCLRFGDRPTSQEYPGPRPKLEKQLLDFTLTQLLDNLGSQANWTINNDYRDIIAKWNPKTLRFFCVLTLMIRFYGAAIAQRVCTDTNMIVLAVSFLEKIHYVNHINVNTWLADVYVAHVNKLKIASEHPWQQTTYTSMHLSATENYLHKSDRSLVQGLAESDSKKIWGHSFSPLQVAINADLIDTRDFNQDQFELIKTTGQAQWIIYPFVDTNQHDISLDLGNLSSIAPPKNTSTLISEATSFVWENDKNMVTKRVTEPNTKLLATELLPIDSDTIKNLTDIQITDQITQYQVIIQHINDVLSSDNQFELPSDTRAVYQHFQTEARRLITLFCYDVYLSKRFSDKTICDWIDSFKFDYVLLNLTIASNFGSQAPLFEFAPIHKDVNEARDTTQSRSKSTVIDDNTDEHKQRTDVSSYEQKSTESTPDSEIEFTEHKDANDPTYKEYMKYRSDVRFGKSLRIVNKGSFGDIYGTFVGTVKTSDSDYFDLTIERTQMERKVALERKKELEKLVRDDLKASFSGNLPNTTQESRNSMHQSWIIFAFKVITWLAAQCSDKPIEEPVLLRFIVARLSGDAREWHGTQASNGLAPTTISDLLNDLKNTFLKNVKFNKLKKLVLARLPTETQIKYRGSAAFTTFQFDCEHYNSLVLGMKTANQDFDSYISHEDMRKSVLAILTKNGLLRVIQNVKGANANPRTYKSLTKALDEAIKSVDWFHESTQDAKQVSPNAKSSNIPTNAGKNVNSTAKKKKKIYNTGKASFDPSVYCKIHKSKNHSYYDCRQYDPTRDPNHAKFKGNKGGKKYPPNQPKGDNKFKNNDNKGKRWNKGKGNRKRNGRQNRNRNQNRNQNHNQSKNNQSKKQNGKPNKPGQVNQLKMDSPGLQPTSEPKMDDWRAVWGEFESDRSS